MYVGGNTLYVNADASKPFVIWHEILHYLKQADPELYAKFSEASFDMLADFRAGTEYADERTQDYIDRGMRANVARHVGFEALRADTFGDAWSDPEFWHKLSGRDLSLAQRVMNVLRKFFDIIKSALHIERHTPMTRDLYDDMDKIKTLVLDTTAEFAAKQPDA